MHYICRKAIKKAKHEHDTEFKDFNLATFENKKNDSHILKLNEIQYYPDANSQALEDTRNKKINNFITKGLHGNLLRDKDTWTGNDLMVRMQFFYRRRIQKLCRNNVSVFLIHHNCTDFTKIKYTFRYLLRYTPI